LIPGATVDRVRSYARDCLRTLRATGNPDGCKVFELTLGVLSDPNTKRLVLDSRQAAVFAESGNVPAFVQDKLKLPFGQFYVELTEPVELAASHSGCTDYIVSFYIAPNGSMLGRDLYILVFFFKSVYDDGREDFGDHEFTYDVESGECWVTKNACTMRWAENRDGILMQDDASTLPERLGPTEPFVAGSFFPDLPIRLVGWWERYVMEMGAFFSWFLSYTMAKSVRIVRLDPAKTGPAKKGKKRRAKGRIPTPWHAVTVDPSFSESTGPGGSDSGREHAYRYDVIGHLRFGRHKCKDGSYTSSIEWVRPHQRGLKHSTYIPKTYRLKAGRVPSGKMREYFKA